MFAAPAAITTPAKSWRRQGSRPGRGRGVSRPCRAAGAMANGQLQTASGTSAGLRESSFRLTRWAETVGRRPWSPVLLHLRRDNPDVAFHRCMATRRELTPLMAAPAGADGPRARCATPPRVVTMNDKPSQVMRHGEGTSMWSPSNACKQGEATVAVSCGNTGALMALSHDPPAQAARRQPPGHRLPLAVAQSRRVQRDAGRGRRHQGRCRGPAAICHHGRVLCAQRPEADAPARRPAERRHRRTQGPRRAEAGA